MQLLDDDMDELFRKAASEYPLKTGTGDWEAMQNRLQAENKQQGPATNGLKDSWWFKLCILAIMTALFLMVAVKGLYNGSRPDMGRGSIVSHHTDQYTTPGNKTADSQEAEVNRTGLNRQDASVQKADTALTATGTTTARTTTAGTTAAGTTTRTITAGTTATGTTTAKTTTAATKENIIYHDAHDPKSLQQRPKLTTMEHATETSAKENSEQRSSYPADRSRITAVNSPAVTIEPIPGIASPDVLPRTGIQSGSRSISIPVRAGTDSNAIVTMKQVKQPSAFLKKGLYYGLVLSPDITTVKGQRTSNLGYNMGVIAGYRFSKKLAVETGVLYERKYYYSVGKYFNAKEAQWSSNYEVLDVDGWCNMYEIPLHVRFTFAAGAKSSWYVNGGMSSYIMKKQAYNYSYDYYGTIVNKDWSSKKTTTDWFSIIHVGVGYERTLGKIGNLRVEPYVKIPARGIGVGDLPVTSIGLNVGLTRPLRLK
jgi:hypothetical protein